MTKSKDITTKPQGAVAEPVTHTKGLEQPVDREDMVMPRAKIVQPITDTGESSLKKGQIYNSLTMEELTGDFVPVYYFKNFIKFNPMRKDDPSFDASVKPGGVIWQTTDGRDPRVVEECRFGTDGSKPTATSIINFLGFFSGSPMPVVLSFMNTSYRAGKTILTLATMFRDSAIWFRKYRVSTKYMDTESGKYYVFNVEASGKTDEAMHDIYESMHEQWSKTEVKVDYSEDHHEGTDEDSPFA